MKKCYVHLEKLPKNMIKNSFVEINTKFENPDDIKLKEYKGLDENVYNDNVSHSLFFFNFFL